MTTPVTIGKATQAFAASVLCLISAGIAHDHGLDGTMMALCASWFILLVVTGILSGERGA